jgi:hypothetical protein
MDVLLPSRGTIDSGYIYIYRKEGGATNTEVIL